RIGVVNLYNDQVGNPAMPNKLKERQSATISNGGKRLPSRLFIGAAVLLIAALAVAAWMVSQHSSVRSTTTRDQNGAEATGEKRIAVLPFKPVSSSENRDQVLELGMADTLIAKLSNSRKIILSSLNAVRKFTALEQDATQAGRELQVNAVLEGNVQRMADRIRVTARLRSEERRVGKD